MERLSLVLCPHSYFSSQCSRSHVSDWHCQRCDCMKMRPRLLDLCISRMLKGHNACMETQLSLQWQKGCSLTNTASFQLPACFRVRKHMLHKLVLLGRLSQNLLPAVLVCMLLFQLSVPSVTAVSPNWPFKYRKSVSLLNIHRLYLTRNGQDP